MAIVEVSIVPMGTPTPSISSYIADCCELARKENGVKSQVNSMSTILEGELDKVMDLVQKMHQEPFRNGVERVVTTVTIDDRHDKTESHLL
ncbi:MTH1187 family thiamine-binding protein [Pelotomaculum isophthalicicum JI]|uniref:MTH1187 family thiamine-binding protein n=1 Tax=Pelotomaculum isophthalicicum JI TaxID=947010 RepID=A0A9X4JVF9_9FIRM|nr:MTH1187 family thiamine-binding protein [Pelotomaculum isophthalicicum]MDF9407317.1 MTH1187 family thiamine-binding protein [Pelotomaculum isophthalicicum JI]